jgi:hypothetical protein
MAAWLRAERGEGQRRIVKAERDAHPREHVRRAGLVSAACFVTRPWRCGGRAEPGAAADRPRD